MNIRFHNTKSGRKETFKPLDPERVTIYVCGPTVYDLVHIGNGRCAVVFDVLYRLLRVIYPEVVYARNITDVDDKINAAARDTNTPIEILTDRFSEAYRRDVAGLGVLEPTIRIMRMKRMATCCSTCRRTLSTAPCPAAAWMTCWTAPG
jgi:cysteinyl-tRNA synthetase